MVTSGDKVGFRGHLGITELTRQGIVVYGLGGGPHEEALSFWGRGGGGEGGRGGGGEGGRGGGGEGGREGGREGDRYLAIFTILISNSCTL